MSISRISTFDSLLVKFLVRFIELSLISRICTWSTSPKSISRLLRGLSLLLTLPFVPIEIHNIGLIEMLMDVYDVLRCLIMWDIVGTSVIAIHFSSTGEKGLVLGTSKRFNHAAVLDWLIVILSRIIWTWCLVSNVIWSNCLIVSLWYLITIHSRFWILSSKIQSSINLALLCRCWRSIIVKVDKRRVRATQLMYFGISFTIHILLRFLFIDSYSEREWLLGIRLHKVQLLGLGLFSFIFFLFVLVVKLDILRAI